MNATERAKEILADTSAGPVRRDIDVQVFNRTALFEAIATALTEAEREGIEKAAAEDHTAMFGAAISAVRDVCALVGASAAFIDDCVALAIKTAYERGKAGEPLESSPTPSTGERG